jgi:type IX secretion system PorP/SprF family membrane protein
MTQYAFRSATYLAPLALLSCCVWRLAAQQLPQYSLYMLNPYLYNPAAAGMDNTLIVNGLYRQQWTDLAGAPVNRYVDAQIPVSIIRSGVGVRFDNENIGAHTRTQAMLSYNYQLELGSGTVLSLGVGGGLMQYSLDGSKLRAPDGTYTEPLIQHNDNLLPDGLVGANTPAFEAGIALRMRKLDVGLAVQPVAAGTLNVTTTGNLRLQPVRHYIATAAYQFEISDNLSIQPSALIKSDFVRTQVEISSIFRWRENIFGGASFRGIGTQVNDAAVIIIGFRLNEHMTLSYGYDVPLSALKAVNRGSHELMLRYSLNKPIGAGKLPPIIYNPRYF